MKLTDELKAVKRDVLFIKCILELGRCVDVSSEWTGQLLPSTFVVH